MKQVDKSSDKSAVLVKQELREMLYEPLDFIQVRTPLFPIEAYLSLHDATPPVRPSFTHEDPLVRLTIAVGSLALLEELERNSPNPKNTERRERKLLRYLIRMSTRPTPYALFAGVDLAQWGEKTNIALASSGIRIRARPDMGWLMHLVWELESLPEVRKHLCFMANSAASIRRGRIFLLEQLPGAKPGSASVSLKATGVVTRALAFAQHPIAYPDLVSALLATTPNATPQKVEALITTLWEHTLLTTDLRLPLTGMDPIQYFVQRLRSIPAAATILPQIQVYLEALEVWNKIETGLDITMYQDLIEKANMAENALSEVLYSHGKAVRNIHEASPEANSLAEKEKNKENAKSNTTLQVDMIHSLERKQLARSIGEDAVYAAELMLRLSSSSYTHRSLEAYHQSFLSRYGEYREIPLLELLDPQFGLGTPYTNTRTMVQTDSDIPFNSLRNQTLLNIALSALHDRKIVVKLDERILKQLEENTLTMAARPPSLEIFAFIAASSAAAINRGDYQFILGPSIGSWQAGSSLARFADMLGPDAYEALMRAAEREEAQKPDAIWAELVYLPSDNRLANVVIRPSVRSHEIVYGASPGMATSQLIPLNELVVGFRNNRFYLRWLPKNVEVIIRAGNMLNPSRAPSIIRFLSDIGYDYEPQLYAFQWGIVSKFPFLPRIQVGRIVLCCAQWRITSLFHLHELALDTSERFFESLRRWREHWNVPRFVYLTEIDHRLLLDLENPRQADELRWELRHCKSDTSIVLQECFPEPSDVWLKGPGGHYMAEFVISLIRRETQALTKNVPSTTESTLPILPSQIDLTAARLYPPGSEWLYVKLYCAESLQDDLIANFVRTFAQESLAQGFAQDWFFIRFADPDPHIRLRFKGDPAILLTKLLPSLCTWATRLMLEGPCHKFMFDVYDREIERYGGLSGISAAEAFFCADSRAVADLLHLLQTQKRKMDRQVLAILSIDDLLAQLGLTQAMRLQWYRDHVSLHPESGVIYRQKSRQLRSLLSELNAFSAIPGSETIEPIFVTRQAALVQVSQLLSTAESQKTLSQPLAQLYRSFVHMHCNRLLGVDHVSEKEVLELLLRTYIGLEYAPLASVKKNIT
jgi:thiopeptide-type bacteriocin biosynthesis protein